MVCFKSFYEGDLFCMEVASVIGNEKERVWWRGHPTILAGESGDMECIVIAAGESKCRVIDLWCWISLGFLPFSNYLIYFPCFCWWHGKNSFVNGFLSFSNFFGILALFQITWFSFLFFPFLRIKRLRIIKFLFIFNYVVDKKNLFNYFLIRFFFNYIFVFFLNIKTSMNINKK